MVSSFSNPGFPPVHTHPPPFSAMVAANADSFRETVDALFAPYLARIRRARDLAFNNGGDSTPTPMIAISDEGVSDPASMCSEEAESIEVSHQKPHNGDGNPLPIPSTIHDHSIPPVLSSSPMLRALATSTVKPQSHDSATATVSLLESKKVIHASTMPTALWLLRMHSFPDTTKTEPEVVLNSSFISANSDAKLPSLLTDNYSAYLKDKFGWVTWYLVGKFVKKDFYALELFDEMSKRERANVHVLSIMSYHMVKSIPSWHIFHDERKLEVMTCKALLDRYIKLPALRSPGGAPVIVAFSSQDGTNLSLIGVYLAKSAMCWEMDIFSTKLFLASESMCPALRWRSSQPDKHYKKLLASKSRDGPSNERKIVTLCKYAAKRPFRILKIGKSLEVRKGSEDKLEIFQGICATFHQYATSGPQLGNELSQFKNVEFDHVTKEIQNVGVRWISLPTASILLLLFEEMPARRLYGLVPISSAMSGACRPTAGRTIHEYRLKVRFTGNSQVTNAQLDPHAKSEDNIIHGISYNVRTIPGFAYTYSLFKFLVVGTSFYSTIETSSVLSSCVRQPKFILCICRYPLAFTPTYSTLILGTEPHSKRVQITWEVQLDVFHGANIGANKKHRCESCARVQTIPVQWVVSVQVHQHASPHPTFVYLEQLILKHGAVASAIESKAWVMASLQKGVKQQQNSRVNYKQSRLRSVMKSSAKEITFNQHFQHALQGGIDKLAGDALAKAVKLILYFQYKEGKRMGAFKNVFFRRELTLKCFDVDQRAVVAIELKTCLFTSVVLQVLMLHNWWSYASSMHNIGVANDNLKYSDFNDLERIAGFNIQYRQLLSISLFQEFLDNPTLGGPSFTEKIYERCFHEGKMAEKDFTPMGGFPRFGVMKDGYIWSKEWCVGPKKRIVNLRQSLINQIARLAFEDIRLITISKVIILGKGPIALVAAFVENDPLAGSLGVGPFSPFDAAACFLLAWKLK